MESWTPQRVDELPEAFCGDAFGLELRCFSLKTGFVGYTWKKLQIVWETLESITQMTLDTA